MQPLSCNEVILNNVNTITKNDTKYKTLYKLKGRITAPFVQWGCPKQSEHNHQNSIKYQI